MRNKRAKREKPQQQRIKVEPLEAQTPNQKEYIRNIIENEIVFCSGPSGSGKSYIAAGIAAHHLYQNQIERIIVTRPLVCAGKDVGSLPGELNEKIAPYLLPMQENIKYFLGRALYGHYANRKQIEFKPLEMMRGATFHDSYMILDEAQNCTIDQIKMFITRMGKNSKVLINGDTNQTDLRGHSGLTHVINKLSNVKGVGVSRLYYEDIQRNGIIGDVLNALEN
jgi:phosphate starvation-inducible protein PhoH and related proteins